MRNLIRSAVALTATCGIGLTGLMAPSHATVAQPLPATAAGTVVAWGAEPGALLPDSLSGVDVVDVAATNNGWGAAVKPDGSVLSWGAGHPDTSGLSNVASVAAVTTGLVALLKDGTVAGADGTASPPGFTPAPALTGVTEIAANVGAAAAVADGTVHIWGTSFPAKSPAMAPPADLANVTSLAGGMYDFTAVEKDHSVVNWGLLTTAVPADVQGHAESIAGGSIASASTYAAVLTDGSVQAWNNSGEIMTPAGLAGKTVVDVTVNGSIVALTADGEVFSWGADSSADALPAFPTPASGVVTAVAAGGNGAPDSTFAYAIVTPFQATAAPRIAGAPVVGHTLTATPATFSLTPDSVTGQWLADGTAIPRATSRTLTVTAAYIGKHISYRSTATKGADTVTSQSRSTASVVAPSLAKDVAKLKHDQAKLKHLHKAYKKAHGAKKAKLKKKIAKLKKTIKTDKKHVAADQ